MKAGHGLAGRIKVWLILFSDHISRKGYYILK